MTRVTRTGSAALALLTMALWAGLARASQDFTVHAPTPQVPQRGHIAGSLAAYQMGAAELVQGKVAFDLPIDVPQERGGPLVSIAPGYSQDNGMGPWGLGWQSGLSVRRFRHLGPLDYKTDAFMSPWGELVRGDDGDFYTVGAQKRPVKFRLNGERWQATLESGTTYLFDAAAGEGGAAGTYLWNLTHVQDLSGAKTCLEYDKNGSGRSFLRRVIYGSSAAPRAYAVTLVYEPLSGFRFPSYRAGYRMDLDRRVASIHVASRAGHEAMFTERWAYDLTYENDALGPAFFLKSVQRRFPGGNEEPAVSYTYNQAAAHLSTTAHRPLPALDNFIRLAGARCGGGFLPGHATLVDDDEDGIPDIEHPETATRAAAGAGWLPQPVPLVDSADMFGACRLEPGDARPPRTLAKFRSDDAQSVVYAVADRDTSRQRLVFCEPSGKLLQQQPTVPASFTDAAGQVAVIDLNGDRRPELVVIDRGYVDIYENISHANAYVFGEKRRHHIESSRRGGVWIYDVNGDGIPDIVSLVGSTVYVWYGHGDLTFAARPERLPVIGLYGHDLSLTGCELVFVDVNHDGLGDFVALDGGIASLFVNKGDHFQAVRVPDFDTWPYFIRDAVHADFAGSGEAELAFMLPSIGAHSVALTQAGGSLLRSVDDGRGNRVELTYARAATQPKALTRHVVVSEVRVQHAGQGADTSRLTYGPATLHTQNRALRGFDALTVQTLDVQARTHFYNDDHITGLVQRVSQHDPLRPGLTQIDASDWELFRYRGTPAWRKVRVTSGWEDHLRLQSMVAITRFDAFENGFCAAVQEQSAGDKRVVIHTTFAGLTLLQGLPHCLPGRVEVAYRHADSTLDFDMVDSVERNNIGRVTRASRGDGRAQRLTQEIAYDEHHRPIRVCRPGQGCTHLTYDGATGQIQSAHDATSVVTTASYDAGADQVARIVKQRGGEAHAESYAYDTYERLAATWDDASGSSAAQPRESLLYTFGDQVKPGVIERRTRVDATGIHRHVQSLQDATGKGVATCVRTADGWWSDKLHLQDISTRRQQSFIPSQSPCETAELTYANLYDQATAQSEVVTDGWGQAALARQRMQGEQWREARAEREVRDGQLWQLAAVNDHPAAGIARDALGAITASVSPMGDATVYTHDARGRLRRAVLADGAVLQAAYDQEDRIIETKRSGVGRIIYAYDTRTGKPTTTAWYDTRDKLVRTARYTHDQAGRLCQATYALPGYRGARSAFAYHYDGDHPDGSHTPGQTGRLTGVSGPGFCKSFVHRADGKPLESSFTWNGWRTLRRQLSYYADGTPREARMVLSDAASKRIISKSVLATTLDAHARPSEVWLQGQPLYALRYNGRNAVTRIDFADSTTIDLSYDAATSKHNGTGIESAHWHGSLSWDLDRDGHVKAEQASFNGATLAHAYGYDARGYLVSEAGDTMPRAYAYKSDGTRDAAKPARDTSGRALCAGKEAIAYGPNGDIAHVNLGRDVIGYMYDETGKRIGRLKNGTMEYGFADDLVVTATQLVSPLKMAHQLVGFIVDGSFTPALADIRGTVLASGGRRDTWPDAFGQRKAHPDLAIAVDYAGSRYDPALGWMRMGARDYDPERGEFTTPDPLVLQNPALCTADPVQCNLYGYAKNNPLSYVDPQGTFAFLIPAAAVATESAAVISFYELLMMAGFGNAIYNMFSQDGKVADAWRKRQDAAKAYENNRALDHDADDLCDHRFLKPPDGYGNDKTWFATLDMEQGVKRTLGEHIDLTTAAIDQAFAGGRVESGPLVQFNDAGGPLEGKTYWGNGRIAWHDNLFIPGAGPNGCVARLRIHSADPGAPRGSTSHIGYTLRIDDEFKQHEFYPEKGGWIRTRGLSGEDRNFLHRPAGG